MRIPLISAAVLSVVALGASATVAQAGCLGGAVVGGVGGHYAGRHATVGALGGCAVGHHMAVVHRRDRMVAQGRGYYDARHHFHRR